MENFPKIGMKCEQVRNRLKRMEIAKNPNVQASLINQARLHEGEGIVNELAREFCAKDSRSSDSNNHSSNRLGYSQKYEQEFKRIFNKGSE
jgi:hypothetical protein